jgi:hypothetical protein
VFLVYPSFRHRLARGESPSSSVGGVPDCRRNRQNQIIQFAKSSPSRNDIQSMINSVLERQAKSADKLLRRLIEERDEKKLDATNVNSHSSTCAVSFT